MLSIAVPYRKTILEAVALGQKGKDEICIRHIEAHLENFRYRFRMCFKQVKYWELLPV